MHRVVVDPLKRRILVSMAGYLSPAEHEQMNADMKDAAVGLRKSGESFDMFVDMREAELIPSAETDKAQKLMEWLKANGLRKSANLVSRTLQKMQISRMAATSQIAFFTDEAEAHQWLES